MAPKKTPKKLDFGPVISTSSHGSSKQETNDPNDKVLLPDDDDDVEPSVAQNATDSIWNQPDQIAAARRIVGPSASLR